MKLEFNEQLKEACKNLVIGGNNSLPIGTHENCKPTGKAYITCLRGNEKKYEFNGRVLSTVDKLPDNTSLQIFGAEIILPNGQSTIITCSPDMDIPSPCKIEVVENMVEGKPRRKATFAI